MKFQKTFDGVLSQSNQELAVDNLLQIETEIFSTLTRFSASRRKLQEIINKGEGLLGVTTTSFSKNKETI